uniref:Uncharacterized protein n=1 Tax=Equus asinus TaxID=9793 RepID=A0A9L0JEC7_EQUAS
MDSMLSLSMEEPVKKNSIKKLKIICFAAAGEDALILHIEDWRGLGGVMWDVKSEATAAGILKTPVWNQV